MTPFVIGRLIAQFGNQLFAIAATYSLALDHGANAHFPDFLNPPDEKLNLSLNYEKVFYHLDASWPIQNIEAYYKESSFSYAPIPFEPNMVIEGWFQSEKYFQKHKNEVIALFAPHPEIVREIESKYNSILNHPKTVSIHCRFYSETENPEGKFYAQCTMGYYMKAIEQFPEDSLFIVFSNQIDRCKELFPSHFLFIEGESHWIDFYLMSFCKHNIICNSSYSWWAAYLNLNPEKKVIAPSSWFNPSYIKDTQDLIPADWIQLSTQTTSKIDF